VNTLENVIESLVDLRKNGVPAEYEVKYDEEGICQNLQLNATFYFDLPCELTFQCYIITDENAVVWFICFDVVKDGWYAYDATSILSGEMS